MNHTEQILEINRIKDKMLEFTYTESGKQAVMELVPELSEIRLTALLRETTEAARIIEKYGNPPLTDTQSMKESLITAVKGGCLSPEQLERVGSSLAAVKRLQSYLHNTESELFGLSFYGEELEPADELREAIHNAIRSGKVDAKASTWLWDLRKEITLTEVKLREKAEQILKSVKLYAADQFTTLRNGRVCIPIKKEYRQKVQGTLVDKSSTGNTLFMEPAGVQSIREELDYLHIEEENEENRILYQLSAKTADLEMPLLRNMEIIEKLDFAFAKGKLSLWYQGCQPVIGTGRYIRLKEAHHPLMDRTTHVPLDFEIGGTVQGVLITGPNTGGKTVAIKTVALCCYLAQCGLHVPCEEAEISMTDRILCDIGDGQNISENLSTFSAHITGILDILKAAGPQSLVILDELGSGTDPAEGMGIAIAILEALRESKALFLVTTHYPEVKKYAHEAEGLLNARMAFDKESLRPLYRLELGEAGESCAFYIAARLGMPLAMLERASMESYGIPLTKEITKAAAGNHIDYEKGGKIQKKKSIHTNLQARDKFSRGDCVMVYPEKKLGIVCAPSNEQGQVLVQLKNIKYYISHKRLKLHVKATELYPEDYDFSTIFHTVAFRKQSKQLGRKYRKDLIIVHK